VAKEKLPELPASDHKFWQFADKIRIKPVEKPKCNHFFIYKKANVVECKNCHAGYFIGPGWKVDKGHLYKGKQLVI